jgi:hypothetical protein
MDVRNRTSALHAFVALHAASTTFASSKEYGDFIEQIARSSFIKMNANTDHEDGFSAQTQQPLHAIFAKRRIISGWTRKQISLLSL